MPGLIPPQTAQCRLVSSLIVGKNENDAMPQWDDVSGNARHLTEGVGANQPLYKTTGRPFPAVLFDGANDLLTSPSFVVNAPCDIFLVVRLISGTGDFLICSGSDHMAVLIGGGASWSFYNGGETIPFAGLPGYGTWVVLTMHSDGTKSFGHVNGGNERTGNLTTGMSNPFSLGSRPGGALWSNMEAAELAIYQPALPADIRYGYEVYLTSTYNTADLVGAKNTPIFGALRGGVKQRDPRLRLAESLGVNARTMRDAADLVEAQKHRGEPLPPTPSIRRSPDPIPDPREILDSTELWADRAWPEPGK